MSLSGGGTYLHASLRYITPLPGPGFRHIVIRSTRPAPSQALIGSSATDTQRPTQNSPFLSIPVEILLLISEKLDDRCDLSRLARTCMPCYQILNPILYRNDIRFMDSSSLICGAATGVLNTVKLAHIYGADLNMESCLPLPGLPRTRIYHTDSRGVFITTALHWAAKTNRLEVAEWLLDHGADIEKPAFGMCGCEQIWDPANNRYLDSIWTPLHTAICWGKVRTAQALIDRGASLTWSNEQLMHTALHSAARAGNLRLIGFMAANSLIADINQGDSAGNTPLHHLATLRGDTATDRTLSMLLNLGADIEKVNASGFGPLVHACQKKNFSLARNLLAQGANPNPEAPPTARTARDSHHLPIFHCVDELLYAKASRTSVKARKRALYFLRDLLDKGAGVDARIVKDGRELTSLMRACQFEDIMLVQELIRAGASVNAETLSGSRPIDFLPISYYNRPNSRNASISAILIRHGARPSTRQAPGGADLEFGWFGWWDSWPLGDHE